MAPRRSVLLVAWIAVLSCAGCIAPSSVTCGAGVVCPAGSVCDDVHGGCALPVQLAQCAGMPELAVCSYPAVPEGACYDGVCLPAGCGNGEVSGAEICDDGNRFHGDGCSADCRSTETCGNQFVDVVKGEACDDGNNVDGDGCRANCASPSCGDGIVDADRMEQCDAGAANSDATDAACRTTCQPKRCGDGVIDTGELCDDGNVGSNDGCSADCSSLEGCGNSIVDIATGEQCDDGNNTNNDGCQANCKIPRCGDGVVDTARFEQCDAGAANSENPNAACRTNCRPRRCGDAVVDIGEVCDDGNSAALDGCTPDCLSNETCGNGVIDVLLDEVCDDGDQQSHDGCTACESDRPVWTRARPGVASGRQGAAYAYDAARGRLVMFGGVVNGITPFGDTWEWDGASWTNVTPSTVSPPARGFASLAYDASRRVVVLFGGDAYTAGRYADTWEWNGTVWVNRAPPGPTPVPQAAHGMTYDSARRRVVLSTGYGSGPPETWEWDGSVWTNKTPSGAAPSYRWGHRLAYDAARGRVVLFGGEAWNTATYSDETWEWDGSAWTNLTPASGNPPVRAFHALAYDPSRRRVVLTGGYNSNGPVPADAWEWNGTAWSNVTPATGGPGAHYNHVLAYDGRERLVMTSGLVENVGLVTDTWGLSGSTWSLLSTALVTPPPRADHAVAYDAARGRLVMFGGGSSGALDDTWEWDGTTWAEATPGSGSPSMRRDHALTYDAQRRRVLLFGGVASGSTVADTWEWNGTTWTDVTPVTTSPAARSGHAIAYDAARNRTVLFGGQSGSSLLADTWEWNGTAWTNMTPASGNPSARTDHALGYDARRGRIVLFGGTANGVYSSDTWEWNGTAWVQVVASVAPPPRANHSLAYDASRARLLLFGGTNSSSGNLGDSWEWNGTAWKSATSAALGPIARQGAAIGYDAARAAIVMFGGSDGSELADTWIWRYQSSGFDERCIGSIDADLDGLFGCADPDCFGYCTPLCNPTAMTCAPTWQRCGDGTCQPIESARLCPADCGAPTVICGDFRCEGSETASNCPGDCP